jgi:uncharacterized OB-fold protein
MLGGAHNEFWQWCSRSELRLQRCASCNDFSWPAVDACDNCGSTSLVWERLSGKGRIASWCSFERDYYDSAFPLPWTTILVELAEGPYFISNPGNFANDAIEFGMPVEVAFLRCEDDEGPFNLPVFNSAK